MNTGLHDSTLVLLGHGSTQNSDSEKPVFQHAATLRAKGLFASVREAFWKQEPGIRTVLAGITTAQVVIVPVFISEGYFSEEVIPAALGFEGRMSGGVPRVLVTEGQKWIYCRSMGTHAGMSAVLLDRAEEVIGQFPFPFRPSLNDTTLFVAGHGTPQNAQSRQAIEHQAEQLRKLKKFAEVHAVFLEESPLISDCYALAQTKNIIMVPFFVSDGLHVCEDIPVLLGEPERLVRERLEEGRPTWRNPTERKGKRVWYARSVGTDPMIADVIMDVVRDSLASCA